MSTASWIALRPIQARAVSGLLPAAVTSARRVPCGTQPSIWPSLGSIRTAKSRASRSGRVRLSRSSPFRWPGPPRTGRRLTMTSGSARGRARPAGAGPRPLTSCRRTCRSHTAGTPRRGPEGCQAIGTVSICPARIAEFRPVASRSGPRWCRPSRLDGQMRERPQRARWRRQRSLPAADRGNVHEPRGQRRPVQAEIEVQPGQHFDPGRGLVAAQVVTGQDRRLRFLVQAAETDGSKRISEQSSSPSLRPYPVHPPGTAAQSNSVALVDAVASVVLAPPRLPSPKIASATLAANETMEADAVRRAPCCPWRSARRAARAPLLRAALAEAAGCASYGPVAGRAPAPGSRRGCWTRRGLPTGPEAVIADRGSEACSPSWRRSAATWASTRPSWVSRAQARPATARTSCPAQGSSPRGRWPSNQQ